MIYFQAYLAAVALLLWLYWGDLTGGDRLMRVYLLAAIFGSAAGGAAVFTVIVEAGGYMVLLIPARIKKLKDEGRKERDKRFDEAVERFSRDVNGQRMLPLTPNVRRFLVGEEVDARERPRRYGRARRRRG